MPRLTAQEIHNKEFKRSMRGYDINEVNEFLDQIILDYTEFENSPQNLGLNNENTDKLSQLEHLLEQLIADVQQLREENRLLREQLNPDPYRPQKYYR
ncbi:DivIVA domain-containing protein [Paenactinomyces guangxiensis]|uniref:DivIVA domain-containing protein n=1 Tax=Paenactinomyces guangxiensis TaxID=1490290 RepID=A0A7W1WSC9_9BACL|nr:DivIVA domain-containing protein [Paenactinomyces guangxiensis]MBA4494951.1 DivIVA domain-containing protein [Paenactinomyces guangxiensis]MBH8592034.1 DivIVA domain-containing protein [Paenactinomyces guangxiensis]